MRIKRKRYDLRLLAVLIALLALICCPPPFYFAKPTQGTVVDDETGKPIEGAVIVAQWILYTVGIGHGGHGAWRLPKR